MNRIVTMMMMAAALIAVGCRMSPSLAAAPTPTPTATPTAGSPPGTQPLNVEVTIEFVENGTGTVRHLSPGVWALVGAGASNPFFVKGSADGKAPGLKALAEVGSTSRLNRHLSDRGTTSGVFTGASAGAGRTGTTSFRVAAVGPGDRLYFVTMVAPSNDWFVAPDEGITLVDDRGRVDPGPHTLYVFDAGTEEENPGEPVTVDGPDDDDMTVRIVTNAMFAATATVQQR